jgi:hypothetical protein
MTHLRGAQWVSGAPHINNSRSGSLALQALPEAVALPVELQDVTAMGQAVEQRAGETRIAKDVDPTGYWGIEIYGRDLSPEDAAELIETIDQ